MIGRRGTSGSPSDRQPARGPGLARRGLALLVVSGLGLAACTSGAATTTTTAGPASTSVPTTVTAPPAPPATTTTSAPDSTTSPTTTTTPAPTTTTTAAPVGTVRPAWLGTRVLPLTATGFGEVLPTPPELVDRRFPPPPEQAAAAPTVFEGTVEPPSADVLAGSTWTSSCPVDSSALRLLRLTYWGFDGLPHRGEMLVNADAATDLVGVFEALYHARFPIEEMRLVTSADLDAPPTGDGNTTSAFACRPVTGATSTWSQHAYGLAVDVNPFQNPYVRDGVVLPELATAYLDRTRDRPGMIRPGDVVVQAFAAIGWEWGGDWSSLKDYQHFSRNGR